MAYSFRINSYMWECGARALHKIIIISKIGLADNKLFKFRYFEHFCTLLKLFLHVRGLAFSSEGVPNLQKVGVDKTATPLFRQQKFYDPPSPIHLTP